MLTEKQATEKANQLCQKLNDSIGGRWEPNVWENLGWHYEAELGTMSVTEWKCRGNGKMKYSCMVSKKVGGSGTPVHWSNDYYGHDPAEAVSEALKVLKEEVYRTTNVYNLNILELQ